MPTAKRDERNSGPLRPTPETYDPLQYFFDQANAALFDRGLPNALITLQRKGASSGFVHHAKFMGQGAAADELALNPAHVTNCTTRDLLVELVHLMIHLWQRHYGKPGRGPYHNREFARAATKIGLPTTITGEPGGKRTGDKVSHYIVEGGPFHRMCSRIEARGYGLVWSEILKQDTRAANADRSEIANAKSGKRVRYICPLDHFRNGKAVGPLRMWGPSGVEVKCAQHDRALLPG